jgi:hypothetical protein
MDKITYTVCDPDNRYHTVQYQNERWYGIDNLVTAIDNTDVKWYTLRKLKQLMLTEVEGKWAGFEWVPID